MGRRGELRMKARLKNSSISRKTILLLLLFVLLPSILVGSLVIYLGYKRNEDIEQRLVMQRLENKGHSIEKFMNPIEEMGADLADSPSVRDILKNRSGSDSYYECTSLIKNTILYHDEIQKVQILSKGKTVWNYGRGFRYIFSDTGNEEYAARIEAGDDFAFWSPAHAMYSLKNGVFSEKCWMTTYYRGVIDTDTMSVLGVLAIQILEEDYCSLYEDTTERHPIACWVENADKEIISSTEKSFFEQGLPEEIHSQIRISGNHSQEEIQVEGQSAVLYRERCGNTNCFIMYLDRKNHMGIRIFRFILLISALFILFCLVYLFLYRKLVIYPLEDLSAGMDRARKLTDQRKEQEYGSFQEAAANSPKKSGDFSLEKQAEFLYSPLYSQNRDEIQILTDHFQKMLGEIDSLINKVYVEKIKAQQAEQRSLLDQINPHFLYNTLDSIHWNALRNGDRDTGEQLEALSSMLREILNFGQKHTTVERELSIVKNYCYLLEARFHREIRVEIQEDASAMQIIIPKLILQPLVENAYKHGLENKVGPKEITVKVKKRDDRLLFYVADNGMGCDPKKIMEEIKKGGRECFALRNIQDRLRLEYDGRAVFRFWSRQGFGTIVKLILPIEDVLSKE